MFLTQFFTRKHLTSLAQDLAALPSRGQRGRLVTYYDGAGRKRRVAEDEWRRRVLPRQLARHADDARSLHRLVASAVDHGCAADVVEASARLLTLEPAEERHHLLHATVLCRSGRTDSAERLLAARERQRTSPALLVARARIAEQGGRAHEADDLLQRAIDLDVNDAEALDCWLASHRRRGGIEGWLAALKQAAARPGSWRPQALLAGYCMERGDGERAMGFCRAVLDAGAAQGEALAAVAGELVRRGEHASALALVEPLYDPARHGAAGGLALLDACLATRDLARGRRLVHRLFMLYRHEQRDRLQSYANRLVLLAIELEREAAAARAAALAAAAAGEQPQVRVVTLDQPVWWYGLRCPLWLATERGDEAPSIAFLPVAGAGAGEEGRQARGLPLHLAEWFSSATPALGMALIPVHQGHGLATPDAWSDGEVRAVASQAQRVARQVVSAEVRAQGTARSLVLAVHGSEGRLAEFAQGLEGGFGAAVAALVPEVMEYLGLPAARDPGQAFVAPAPQHLGAWLGCTGDCLELMLVQSGVMPRRAVLADIAAIDGCLDLVRAMPAAQGPVLLAAAALAVDAATGSTLHRDYRAASRDLAEAFPDRDTAAHRISPLLLWLADDGEAFSARRDDLLSDAGPAYREWLEGLGCADDSFVVVED